MIDELESLCLWLVEHEDTETDPSTHNKALKQNIGDEEQCILWMVLKFGWFAIKLRSCSVGFKCWHLSSDQIIIRNIPFSKE